ncbi:TPM domain-containing protein [Azospira restricta]|uniref:TPM domain-containing protein n=1 Tax=Azospira restricta TaxID=404405 RepID=A0A974PWM9_9RHOO|nr:TPM domain-containing protein [Azospira restricta]QRJ62863.1 TPM domain-containing protein [Azospira restricta]
MRRVLAALWLAGWAALAGAQDLQPVPALTARVTDLTATLSSEQRSQLETKLAAFEREKGVQIAVLLVPTTQPEAIEQYAIRVAEQWKLGRQGVDDGALLLIAKQDRKLRIEVGYGLEGALNDATAKRIVAETITPQFRERRFYEGIDAGVERIFAVVGGEPLPPAKGAAGGTTGQGGDGFDIQDILVVGLVLVTVVAGILRAIFGRFLGAAAVGGLAGFIVMAIASSLLIAVIAGVVVFVLALLSGGRGFGGFSGGSWGGSGGGGFGGFSGGGGGFGGGGASGDW